MKAQSCMESPRFTLTGASGPVQNEKNLLLREVFLYLESPKWRGDEKFTLTAA